MFKVEMKNHEQMCAKKGKEHFFLHVRTVVGISFSTCPLKLVVLVSRIQDEQKVA